MRDSLDILMFVTVCAVLMAGFPVAFTLAGVGLFFALVGWTFGVFDLSIFGALPSRIYGNAMTNEVLLAVPLFVFMGVMLERSKVAEELLDTMAQLFGTLRGGLGISVCIVGALLAASTGIVGATVVTMGLLSLPTMLRRNYKPELACGTICASGTLGQIIPPSIVLVILGDQISNAYVDAQRSLGNWSPDPVSVGDLFAGALLPGLMLVALYISFLIVYAFVRPETCPAVPREPRTAHGTAFLLKVGHALVPPVALIIAVLGSILAGVATPTEAAAVGAIGATLLAGLRVQENVASDATPPSRGSLIGRLIDDGGHMPVYGTALGIVVMLALQAFLDLRVARNVIPAADMVGIVLAGLCSIVVAWGLLCCLARVWAAGIMHAVMRSTMEISSMVFVILIGATVFSLVFRGLGGDDLVHGFLAGMPGGALGAMTVVMLVMFILGFLLDFIEICFVVVPVVAPVLLRMDINPVWLGVMMGINLQTSFLTPPFGFSLFYLRGVAPPAVTTMHIYRGIVPFVVIQILALIMLAIFPDLATWLPRVVFG